MTLKSFGDIVDTVHKHSGKVINIIHSEISFIFEKIYHKQDSIRDTLLFFNNIEASFVIGKIGKDTIGISARSLGNYDISEIMVKLGGGGTKQNGAAKFEKTTISRVEQELKKILKEMGE